MLIKAIVETSFLDWDGKISTVVFVPECNFHCPYCQNWQLIEHPEKFEEVSFEKIKEFLLERKGFIDGVCITGGEPTLYEDLPEFAGALKNLGFGIKLDTNGSIPEMIEKLIKAQLVDYVALDFKAPFEKYNLVTGANAPIHSIKESVSILMNSNIDYEFRTTLVPTLLDENDVLEIARYIKGCKRYVLQQFVPQQARSERLGGLQPYRKEKFEKIAEEARKFIKEVKLRGVW
ncbi:MAG: anaerobic ribonucleoside-triphosphate reductase activating protein [Candidatus Thermoplasmatota archaeon]